MRILDFLGDDTIEINLKATNKKDVIEELVNRLVAAGKVSEKEPVVKTLMEREELGSTGIGNGIAIPHGKSPLLKGVVAAFGRSPRGIDFDSLDGEPVYLFFLLVAPEGEAAIHLKALAKISRLLKDKYFRQGLMKVKSVEEVKRIIQEEEEAKEAKE